MLFNRVSIYYEGNVPMLDNESTFESDQTAQKRGRHIMRPDVYWRIYRPDRIKPHLRGNLIFVLEIPANPNGSVLRHIFDPSGMDFPAQPRRGITRLLAQQRQGIVFDGVSKAAIEELMKSNPEAPKSNSPSNLSRHDLVGNSRSFFLTNPEPDFEVSPEVAEHLSGTANPTRGRASSMPR
jgi:hypothetical protein